MSNSPKLLYWGDNGVHEFWESEDRELLIFRNRQELFWSAHRTHGFLFYAPSAEEAAFRLQALLSPMRKWVRRKPGAFCLVSTGKTSKTMEAKYGLGLPKEVISSLASQGIGCNPAITIVHQRLGGGYVLRAEESGGAVREIGAYCGYVNDEGRALPSVAPIDTVRPNGRHAVIVAQSFVRLHTVREQHSCEVLITRHSLGASPTRKRPTLQSEVLFRGTCGGLSVNLCDSDRELRGRFLPDFISRSRKAPTIPAQFGPAVRVALGAAYCVDCSHPHLLRHLNAVGDQWPCR